MMSLVRLSKLGDVDREQQREKEEERLIVLGLET